MTDRHQTRATTNEGKQTMAYEQKPNTGSLFRNEKMREGKKDADYTGSALIDGQEYWLNAYLNELQGEKHRQPNGKQKLYFNIQFKPKEQRPQQSGGSPRQQTQQPAPAEEGDIPF